MRRKSGTFDPAAGLITSSRYWHPVRGHREEQVGRWNGRDILQEGTRPDGTKTRWTFTENHSAR